MLGILLFLGINILCFVPAYLVNIKNQKSPLPFFLFSKKNFRKNIELVNWKISSDILRVNLDFTCFFVLAYFFPNPYFIGLASLFYVFGLLLFFYTQIMLTFFERDPVILNDITFAKTGWILLGKYRYIYAFLALLLITSLIIGIYLIIEICLSDTLQIQQYKILFFTTVLAISILGFWKLSYFPLKDYKYRTAISPSLLLYISIKDSFRNNKFRKVNSIKNKNDFTKVKLTDKPNIVVVSVESLGSVIFKESKFNSDINSLIQLKQNKLDQNGIHLASSFTKSTIYSGASWLAFSSFLNGIEIENELEYADVFKSSKLKNYTSFPSFLKQNGYFNIYLSGLVAKFKYFKIDWKTLTNVTKADHFLTYQEINYQNKLLHFGDIKAIPDEYSLNTAYQIAKGKAPFFLFFPSLNSHYQWHSPLKSQGQWKDYDHLDFETTEINKSFSEKKYIDSIKYQYDYLINFIQKNADDNTVFVLFGDHQPPKITPKGMNKNTALYIISKNHDFIESFHKEGFHNSLDLKNISKTIKHEGFSSLFLKKLIEFHGKGHEHIEVLPDGIKPDKE